MIDRINNTNNINNIRNQNLIQGKTKKNTEKLNEKEKEVIILSGGKKFAELLEEAKNVPEVRNELINELKNAIENGTFKVDPKNIAKKILEG